MLFIAQGDAMCDVSVCYQQPCALLREIRYAVGSKHWTARCEA